MQIHLCERYLLIAKELSARKEMGFSLFSFGEQYRPSGEETPTRKHLDSLQEKIILLAPSSIEKVTSCLEKAVRDLSLQWDDRGPRLAGPEQPLGPVAFSESLGL